MEINITQSMKSLICGGWAGKVRKRFTFHNQRAEKNNQCRYTLVFKLQHPSENTAGLLEAAHGNFDLYYNKVILQFYFKLSLNEANLKAVWKLHFFTYLFHKVLILFQHISVHDESVSLFKSFCTLTEKAKQQTFSFTFFLFFFFLLLFFSFLIPHKATWSCR